MTDPKHERWVAIPMRDSDSWSVDFAQAGRAVELEPATLAELNAARTMLEALRTCLEHAEFSDGRSVSARLCTIADAARAAIARATGAPPGRTGEDYGLAFALDSES